MEATAAAATVVAAPVTASGRSWQMPSSGSTRIGFGRRGECVTQRLCGTPQHQQHAVAHKGGHSMSGLAHTWRMAVSASLPRAPYTMSMLTKLVCSSAVLSAGVGLYLQRHSAFSLSLRYAPCPPSLTITRAGSLCLAFASKKSYEEIADLADADDDDLIKDGLKKPEIRRLRRYIAEA